MGLPWLLIARRPDDDARRAPARRRRARWLTGGGIAAALAVLVAWQSTADPACAAVLAAPGGSGKATFYELGSSGGGNCSFPGIPRDGLYAALGPSEYAAAGACGSYLDVTGPRGTVRVQVVDSCPECAPGHVDLSRAAFARIADPVQGIVPITYRTVTNPALDRTIGFRVKEGSSQYWFALLVLDHGTPLRSVQVRSGGGWTSLKRQSYNYWLAESGAGTGPFTVRVTDTAGRTATATGIHLAPGQVQRSSVRLGGAGGAPAAAPRRTTATRTAAPRVTATGTRPRGTGTVRPEAARATRPPGGTVTPGADSAGFPATTATTTPAYAGPAPAGAPVTTTTGNAC